MHQMVSGVLHGGPRDQIALLAAFDKYVPEAINPEPPYPTKLVVEHVMPDGKTLADYGLEEPSGTPDDDKPDSDEDKPDSNEDKPDSNEDKPGSEEDKPDSEEDDTWLD